jgi:DNA replication protein DnaC
VPRRAHGTYTPAHEMRTQLRKARTHNRYERRLLRFTTPDLVITDDLGLRLLTRDEPIDLYEIIRTRYDRASTIIVQPRRD